MTNSQPMIALLVVPAEQLMLGSKYTPRTVYNGFSLDFQFLENRQLYLSNGKSNRIIKE